MTTVKISASTTYEILIGKGLIDSAGELSARVISPCRACIVSDDTVAALYLERVERSLRAAGFDTVSFVFAHGESSKSTQTLVELVEFLAENRLTRSDCLFALGGGVVGDLCGFAAAIYLRGIKFIQIPTTLLAAVDSSVGGKTGVDLRAGKNLAGAFHQPSLVICDYQTLDTLPENIFADGCAEVIKYGIIDNREFFDTLRSGGIKPQIEQVIATSVECKRRVVEEDEFDNGKRQLLNLGHTVGHAIEVLSNFEISHGSAVAIGTVIVMRSAVNGGICQRSELDEVIELLLAVGLPTVCPFEAGELYSVATADKKRKGEHITLAVPYAIGDTRLKKIHVDELYDFILRGLEV